MRVGVLESRHGGTGLGQTLRARRGAAGELHGQAGPGRGLLAAAPAEVPPVEADRPRAAGVYRLVHHPAGDQEELIVLWLWSEQAGVFSHETALSLHRISDVLPSRFHLTLPLPWKKRRLRVPDRVTLYYENLLDPERTWVGAVPVTTVARTLSDCLDANVTTDTIRAAVRDASRRGLLGLTEVQAFLNQLYRMEGNARGGFRGGPVPTRRCFPPWR